MVWLILGMEIIPMTPSPFRFNRALYSFVRLNAFAGEEVPGEGILCNGGVVGQGGLHLGFVGFGRSLADSLLIVA